MLAREVMLTCKAVSLTLYTLNHMYKCCRDLLSARWCAPTLSIVDVRIGDDESEGVDDDAYRFGPTRFSVIPRLAVGNVSIRFVPDQSSDKLIELLKCDLNPKHINPNASCCTRALTR